jgi:hypothetical protein
MNKKWYESKAVWGAILLLVNTVIKAAFPNLNLPWDEIYGLAAALGIYGLRTATKEIK